MVLGEKKDENGKTEYMVASESVALDVSGFKLVRDVKPGEALLITKDGQLYSKFALRILIYSHVSLSMFTLLVQIALLMEHLYMQPESAWARSLPSRSRKSIRI